MIESENASILRNIRVLFVDDEEFVTKSMKVILGRVFGEVYTALNGQEGLNMYIQHSPDLVITDITMPKMNGFEMMQKIRNRNGSVRFIVVSGHNDYRYVEKARDLGAIHITKPIEKRDLVQAIEQTLDVSLSFA